MPSPNDVFERDDYRCVYCGLDARSSFVAWLSFRIDHFKPKKLGGTDDPANLVTSCSTCNDIKGSCLFETREDAKAFILPYRKKERTKWERLFDKNSVPEREPSEGEGVN